MKTSKWFYGIALATAVSFTAAADTTPSNINNGQTSGQNNMVLKGKSDDHRGHRDFKKHDKDKNPPPTTTTSGPGTGT